MMDDKRRVMLGVTVKPSVIEALDRFVKRQGIQSRSQGVELALRAALEGAVPKMYAAIGATKSKCKACARTIWWVTTKNGKRAPYTAEGFSHFVDCPKADQFRKD